VTRKRASSHDDKKYDDEDDNEAADRAHLHVRTNKENEMAREKRCGVLRANVLQAVKARKHSNSGELHKTHRHVPAPRVLEHAADPFVRLQQPLHVAVKLVHLKPIKQFGAKIEKVHQRPNRHRFK